jgi:hypothetical protein
MDQVSEIHLQPDLALRDERVVHPRSGDEGGRDGALWREREGAAELRPQRRKLGNEETLENSAHICGVDNRNRPRSTVARLHARCGLPGRP